MRDDRDDREEAEVHQAGPAERAAVERMTRVTVVGSPETVRAPLQSLVKAVQPDELIFSGHIFDQSARLYSYELLMEVCRSAATPSAPPVPCSQESRP